MSHSTHNRSFRRRVFSGNQLHWYWQPKTIKHNTTYTRNTKEKQKKTALANKTIYTLIWYAFYDPRSGNGVGRILTAPEPTRDPCCWHADKRKWFTARSYCNVESLLVLSETLSRKTRVFSCAVVTCEIKLFQNYLNLRRRPTEIIMSFQRVENCLKLFQNYFTGLLQIVNIFQHVRRRRNNFEIFRYSVSCGWNDFISVSDMVTCEIKHRNYLKII